MATGTIPYPEAVFGRLRVFEETGRQALGAVGEKTRILTPAAAAAAGDAAPVRVGHRSRPGPPPPLLLPGARSAGSGHPGGDRRALPRVRAPRQHADQPHRGRHQAAALPDPRRAGRGRRRPPRRLPRHHHERAAARPAGTGPARRCRLREPAADAERAVRGAVRGRQHSHRRAPRHEARRRRRQLVDAAAAVPGLEQGDAGAGGRLARGRRLERELRVERDRPRRARSGRSDHQRAARHHRRRDRPEGGPGLLPGRHGGARDRRRPGAGRPASPPSGSIFRVGRNAVLCTATDPATGKVGLAEFAITVVDGPPQIYVPPTSRRGGPACGPGR